MPLLDRRRPWPALLLLLALPGCATLASLGSREPLRVYGGVRFAADRWRDPERGGGGIGGAAVRGVLRPLEVALLVLDLPLSLALDTALLPITGTATLVRALRGAEPEPEEEEGPRPSRPVPSHGDFAVRLRLAGEPTVLVLDTAPGMHEPVVVRDPPPDGPPVETDGVTTGAVELAACLDALFDGTLFNVATSAGAWSQELRVLTPATRREAAEWLATVGDVTSSASDALLVTVGDPRVRRVVVASAPGAAALVSAVTAANPLARVDVGLVGAWPGTTGYGGYFEDRSRHALPWRTGRRLTPVRYDTLLWRARPPTLPVRLRPPAASTVFVVDQAALRPSDELGTWAAEEARRELSACVALAPPGARVALAWGAETWSSAGADDEAQRRDAIAWLWRERTAAAGVGPPALALARAPGVQRVVIVALDSPVASEARLLSLLAGLEGAQREVVLVTRWPPARAVEAAVARAGGSWFPL